MFHVGQLVVCIDDDGDLLDGLTKGRIYTIRLVGDFNGPFGVFPNGVKLNEIVRKHHFFPEPPYEARRFRPVDDNRIAIFREALVPGPRQRVRA